ncbi:N-carbamyl-L-cysteine amidohydrolase [Treponema primitia ZAS-2]|uniref:N-carbamyl-L-cysteine amidohydrolase n=1 Tax=Treponema primitia (strain ATCC BAA-887 / DSM 12427 / ZAS-2) TaxID=545694 RepID=F5YM80_TREPZ|nr:Zn-dependent hydrolase [Treponema primitia]AEF86658.1 N-carbamyl-L-cysteine amidohydrolase [Treponema primitia ZAS-2]
MFTCGKDRVKDKIESFAKFGDTGKGGITRFSLSPEAIAARKEFIKRMEALGIQTVTDDMANMYATAPGTDSSLPRIVLASHLDSVRNGGNYDGILGVITALEVVETIVRDKIPHRHPITAMVWTNEEGSLYPPAMMSSGVICKKFEKATVLKSKSVEGKTFGEALEASGFAGSESNRLNPQDYCAMLELHIEQGPIMEAEKKQIGVVDGVLGMFNYRISAYGQSDHAGTTPMSFRRDALLAAADAIKYIHTELDKLAKDIVYTTGEIVLHPNVHTVIPDFVEFSLDVRHWDPAILEKALEVVKNIPKEIDKCEIKYKEAWSRKRVSFKPELVDLVEKNAKELGYSYMRIHSGPGHDAQYVADLLPTTMIFVPSKDGHSHCEEEFTSVEEAWQGINVALNTIIDIDKQ